MPRFSLTRVVAAAVFGTALTLGAASAQANVQSGNYQTHRVPTPHQYQPEHHVRQRASESIHTRVEVGNYQQHVVPAAHPYQPEPLIRGQAPKHSPRKNRYAND